jgi:hypothetical protein
MELRTADPQLEAFCRRWRITELSVFGSVARGETRPDSDVDVLVRFAPDAPWSAFDLVTMQDELSQIWGRPVDLVEAEGLRNPFRRAAILNQRTILYAAEPHAA